MTDSRIRTSIGALVAAAALLLTGCGAMPAPAPSTAATAEAAGDQAQQCAAVIAEVEAIAADVGRVGETVGSDPIGALALLSSVSSRVGDLQARVTDPELLERIGEIQAGWDAIVDDAQRSLASGDAAALERIGGALADLSQRVSELQRFCAGTA